LLLALEKARLEADLRASAAEVDASRRRIVVAADHERQRIERDLHDGAQQRLVALRIRLSLLQERASDDPESVADGLERAGEEINATIEEIRNLARGIYPHVLSENGVPDALASVARRLPFEVVVEGDFGRRFAPEVESAVYFCCVEAIQNVAKHGGMRPRARVRLRYGSDGDLRFEVTDDGPGFEPEAAEDGHGIAGMGDRIVAIGGELTIDSSLGAGTLVSGRVPAAALRELDEDEFTRSG